MTEVVKQTRPRAKASDDRTSLPIRLTKETHARLMKVADERMVHASLIVERALVKYLLDLPSVNEELPLT